MRIALAALLVCAGCSGLPGGGAPRTPLHTVGALAIGVANEPAPPRTGENSLVIVVRDAAGRPVEGARVETVVFMPAMGAMPYMESRGKVHEDKRGVYRAQYGLAMAGEWDVTVRVTPAGGAPVEGAWRLSTHLPDVAFAGAEVPAAGAGTGGDGTITIDAARRQTIGVRTAVAETRDLVVPVHARGAVAWDETRRAEVALKTSGFVRDVRADFTGRAVRAGEPLFTFYSPEVWSAAQEYVTALRFARADSAAHAMAFGARADEPPATLTLAEAARRRLLLWDVPADEVDALARGGQPRQTFTVRSPASGVIVEKMIVAGSPVSAGQVLYRIARTDPVWIEAQVYEADLPLLSPGMDAVVTSPYAAGARRGRVAFIGPALTGDARTAVARIELPNPGAHLKPGMFVDVTLEAHLGRRLVVPQDAVVPTGERNFVFVDKGGGRIEPRAVTLGARAGEWTEIASGLSSGETVVTSGNFLVAADARLKSAIDQWQARP